MNINEFFNSNDKTKQYDLLNRNLFLETAHISDLKIIKENINFKEILERGNEFIPFIIDTIINGEPIIAHKLLFHKIIGDVYDNNNFIDSVSDWWNENKHKYEK